VQDDPVNAKVLQKRLQSSGHQVAHANNGQEVIGVVFAEQEFDCVSMDVQ
jgi:CheY-like chemotaxis protein